jgi:hypothetical protein
MNKVLMSLLFSAFILTGVSFAQTPPPAAPAEPAAAASSAAPVMHHEHHPELRKAMRKLRGAKEDLQKATHDYGGHRVKAIEAIDAALAELKEAIAFDKN